MTTEHWFGAEQMNTWRCVLAPGNSSVRSHLLTVELMEHGARLFTSPLTQTNTQAGSTYTNTSTAITTTHKVV